MHKMGTYKSPKKKSMNYAWSSVCVGMVVGGPSGIFHTTLFGLLIQTHFPHTNITGRGAVVVTLDRPYIDCFSHVIPLSKSHHSWHSSLIFSSDFCKCPFCACDCPCCICLKGPSLLRQSHCPRHLGLESLCSYSLHWSFSFQTLWACHNIWYLILHVCVPCYSPGYTG